MQPAICSLAALVAFSAIEIDPTLAAQVSDNLAAAWPRRS
jgi:hypothetical protein